MGSLEWCFGHGVCGWDGDNACNYGRCDFDHGRLFPLKKENHTDSCSEYIYFFGRNALSKLAEEAANFDSRLLPPKTTDLLSAPLGYATPLTFSPSTGPTKRHRRHELYTPLSRRVVTING